MSGTGKRGADKLNIVGVVTVGICGAILTYVSIVLLEAYYMSDTAQIEQQVAFESPQSLRNTVRAANLGNLSGETEGTISIDRAMALVVEDAARDPSNLVPAVGPSRTPTVVAMYGRAPNLPADAAPAPAPAEPEPAPPTDDAAPAPAPGADGP